MSIRMANVLIDTQVFDSLAHDFYHAEFRTLFKLVAKKRVRVFMSSIIDGEVIRHLTANAQGSVQRLQSLLRKHENASLRHLTALNVIALLRDDIHAALIQERLKAWASWKQLIEVQMLPNIADMSGIIADYFAVRPPFGSGQKAKEFPDAFTLSAAIQWCKENRQTLTIVSGDTDIKKFCEGRTDLTHVEKLAPFLEAFSDEKLVGAVRSAFEAIRGDILNDATNYLENIEYTSREVDEFDVEAVEVQEIYYDDISFITVAHGVGVAEIEMWTDYVVDVHYKKRRPSDYEYDEYRVGSMVKQRVRMREPVTVRIDFTYNESDPTEIDPTNFAYDRDVRRIRINTREDVDMGY